jgi:Acetyltransferase (GNAT) family
LIAVQVETWSQMLPEARPLFPLHWKELAVFQDHIKIDLDEAKYNALEQAGILLTLTARKDARLVGYFTWFLMPHPHYRQYLMGMTDMYYVLPEFRRGAGAKLFIKSEAALRERGVIKAITSCKVEHDHTRLLERLGWILTDFTFCKLLGGNTECQ